MLQAKVIEDPCNDAETEKWIGNILWLSQVELTPDYWWSEDAQCEFYKYELEFIKTDY